MWEERTSFHYTPGLSKNFPSLTNPQSITTNDHSTPSHHHQEKPTHSNPSSFNPKPIHHPSNPKPSQAKSSPTQSVARSSKPTNEPKKKQVNQDQNPPTHTHNQPKNQKKKKPTTNKSEQDWRLATPPPPHDNHRHALHPRFRVPPPHPICSWRDSTWSELLWSKLIFLWTIGEFMDTRRNEIRKEEY